MIPPLCIKSSDTRNFENHQKVPLRTFGTVRQKKLDPSIVYSFFSEFVRA